MTNSREHVGTMSGTPLDTITMIDSSFASFMVDIKVLKVVVEIDGSRTEVSTEEGSVSGENGGDVDVTLSAEWDS